MQAKPVSARIVLDSRRSLYPIVETVDANGRVVATFIPSK